MTTQEWEQVRVHGRQSKERRPITLFYSASAVELNVKASNLSVTLDAEYGYYDLWLTIVIDGSFIGRQMLQKGTQTISVFRNMNANKVKNVRLIRDTEAIPEDDSHYIQILDFTHDGTLLPIPKREHMIEFVGDSITTGEGTMGAKGEEDWIPMFFSGYQSYARLVAEALNADYRVISKGGWGIYCGWNNDVTATIPSIYEKVCGILTKEGNRKVGSQEDYDFSIEPCDVLVMNLGTNDGSGFDQPAWVNPEDGKAYQLVRDENGEMSTESKQILLRAFYDFLVMLRKNNPKAHILWTYGMLGSGLLPLIEETIQEYQRVSGDRRISFLLLQDTTEETVGSRYHPGVKAHAAAAKLISKRLSELLGTLE